MNIFKWDTYSKGFWKLWFDLHQSCVQSDMQLQLLLMDTLLHGAKTSCSRGIASQKIAGSIWQVFAELSAASSVLMLTRQSELLTDTVVKCPNAWLKLHYPFVRIGHELKNIILLYMQ